MVTENKYTHTIEGHWNSEEEEPGFNTMNSSYIEILEECTKLQIANFSVDKFFKSARMKRIPLWKQNACARRLRRFIAQVSLRFSGDF